MKHSSTKWRKAWRCLQWLVVTFALAVALLPVWFPWVSGKVLSQFGLRYGRYERLGYTRFVLGDVKGRWMQTELQVKQVECALPTGWVKSKMFPGVSHKPDLIIRDGVLTVNVATNVTRIATAKTNSTFSILDRIEKIGVAFQEYLPAAQLTNCTIVIQSNRLLLPEAGWRNGNLHAVVDSSVSRGAIDLDAKIERPGSLALSLSWKEQQTALTSTFKRERDHWTWDGKLTWLTNRAALIAWFSKEGWWPEHARLEAASVRVPADAIHLKNYQDLTAAVALEFATNQFTLQATGFAQPQNEAGGRLPPLHAAIRIKGDPECITLDQFNIQSPWMHAELTNALSVRRTGQLVGQTARLDLDADLSQVPGNLVTGKVGGQLSVEFKESRQAVARFEFAGTDLGGWGIDGKSASLSGELNWPVLTVDNFNLALEDGSVVGANGVFDVASRIVREARWQASGDGLKRFLHGASYSGLEASGEVVGPVTNLTHSGSISVAEFAGGMFKPVQVNAKWEASGLNFNKVGIGLAAEDSVLSLDCAIDLSAINDREIRGTLESASLSRSNETLYSLRDPCSILLEPVSSVGSTQQWHVATDAFEWVGGDRELSLKTEIMWPSVGAVHVKARNVHLQDVSEFVTTGLSNVSVAECNLDAHWSNAPVRATLRADSRIVDQQGNAFVLRNRIRADDELKIDELTVDSGYVPAVAVNGVVPLQFDPSRGRDWLVLDGGQSITLDARFMPGGKDIPLPLGKLGALIISGPQLSAHASGTFDKPQVDVTLGVESLDWETPTNLVARPGLDDFKFEARITPDLFDLRRFESKIDGQLIEVSGKWPLPPDYWKTLRTEKQLPDWKLASGRIRIDDVEVAALSRYLPKVLAPAGRLRLDLSLAKGGQLGGSANLTNAVTRPMGSLPPLRDISARVHFEGSQAIMDEFVGLMGGQPVHATGRVVAPINSPLDYRVHLEGSNVPLARSIELLLRGDFDLDLAGSGETPPTLAGDVTLRQGLYIRYASDFVWSGPKRPTIHPPYFSITNEPFANWKLNLKIDGDRFLRVRVPVLTGVLTAHANVRGTFRDPILTGDARINSGRVTFPFGIMNLDEGYASLDESDKRGPKLEIHAAGRTLDYDVQLRITGPADEANIEFTSTPPLSSEEILLMLAVGEVPQREYTVSSGARAGRLATFLGRDLISRISGSGTTQDRLIVNTGESISDDGKLTYSVEYLFTDRWSIIGEYDRFNAYNANLKWKVLSR